MTAIGIIQEAQDSGLTVPRDLSVVGFDNIEIGRDIRPHLTTIAIPGFELGKLSMSLLLRMLASRKRGSKQKETTYRQSVETKLVIRSTTSVPA